MDFCNHEIKARLFWRVIYFISRHYCIKTENLASYSLQILPYRPVFAINKLNNCKSFHYKIKLQMDFAEFTAGGGGGVDDEYRCGEGHG